MILFFHFCDSNKLVQTLEENIIESNYYHTVSIAVTKH